MPWIENSEKRYWMPDVLPNPSPEYNKSQSEKEYLTPALERKYHPGWTYDNTELVGDDYFFYNEGWSLIINNVPQESSDYKIIVDDPKDWTFSEDKKKVTITYKKYDIVDDQKPSVSFNQEIELLPEENWNIDHQNLTISRTWNIVNLTNEQIAEKEKNRFEEFRLHRNEKLKESDVLIIRSLENELPISKEVKDYRQKLRDLPQTIDITTWNAQTYIWPTLPNM